MSKNVICEKFFATIKIGDFGSELVLKFDSRSEAESLVKILQEKVIEAYSANDHKYTDEVDVTYESAEYFTDGCQTYFEGFDKIDVNANYEKFDKEINA